MAYIENPSAAGSMNETELFTLSDLKLFGVFFRFLLGPWLLAPGHQAWNSSSEVIELGHGVVLWGAISVLDRG